MKRILLSLALVACALANAQTEVTYYLPQTALRIAVEVRRTLTTPGPLANYAFRYLRLSDVPLRRSETYEIVSATVDAYGVADPECSYALALKGRQTVQMTADGILLALNAQKTEEQLPEVRSGESAKPAPDPRRFYTQEMLVASTEAKLAELAVQKIYDLRESRDELIRGEAQNTPKDGAQLQTMLSEIDLQLEALESLFRGTTQVSTDVEVTFVTPSAEADAQVVYTHKASNQRLLMSLAPEAKLPAQPAEADAKKKPQKGIRYGVPQRERLRLYTPDDRTLVDLSLPMAQFGAIDILPLTLFEGKQPARATFHQQTGALEKLEQ